MSAAKAEFRLGSRPYELTFNGNGALVAWEGELELAGHPQDATAGEIRYRNKSLKLEHPKISPTGGGLKLEYRWAEEPGLRVIIGHRASKSHGAVLWTREFELHGPTKLASDLTVSLESWPDALPGDTWLPLLNGTGADLGTNTAAAFRFAGAFNGNGTLLALPMVSIPGTISHSALRTPQSEIGTPHSSASPIPHSALRTPQSAVGRILVAADPYFSILFASNALEWTYLAKAGLEDGCERRTVVVAVHEGSIEDSLGCFFRAVMADVKPGPAWLHQIAMVDFDYLSDGGQGWFRDIDALVANLSRADRRQVLLCLHGWYDFLGRYCFDARGAKLDREWTAFSSYEIARKAPALGSIGGEQVEVGFDNCKPVKMSLGDVHRRLQYARSRGFRAGLYFADGVNAGDALADFEPDRVLRRGGWQGPDSNGKSYFQNPLNPNVREFFIGYAKALLNEFGPDVDALVWDETFHVGCGELGTETWPGYADRAMMRLVREITELVEDYNRRHGRQIAFLTSDCLGAFGNELKGPYALVSHGTYQDSWCQPAAWSYGTFANYRNVLWSCCWWPVTKWAWVEFGVREYQAPVAISNGWGNDKGFSELTPEQRARVLKLFNWRKKQLTRLKWLQHLPPEPEPVAARTAS